MTKPALRSGLRSVSSYCDQRARDAVANRAGLPGDTATLHLHRDVETIRELRHFERLAHDHAARFASEEFVERAIVDRDRAVAG